MDEKLKQRLMGTVVITLLLAYFLPMLMDDTTDQQQRSLSELKIPQLSDQIFVETLPPMPFNSAKGVAPSSDRNPSVGKKKNLVKSKPILIRWVIQVGSFGSQEHAIRLRDDLRSKKFTVYTEFFQGMYRVRIGPELDRKRAEKTLQFLTKKTQLKGLLMPE